MPCSWSLKTTSRPEKGLRHRTRTTRKTTTHTGWNHPARECRTVSRIPYVPKGDCPPGQTSPLRQLQRHLFAILNLVPSRAPVSQLSFWRARGPNPSLRQSTENSHPVRSCGHQLPPLPLQKEKKKKSYPKSSHSTSNKHPERRCQPLPQHPQPHERRGILLARSAPIPESDAAATVIHGT